MPGPTLRLLLILSLAAAAPTSKPRPAEPEPEPAAAAGQVKEHETNSVITKTTPPGWLFLESPEQAGLQKDHLTYKCLWEKEELLVLRNGREFDLKSETRASTKKFQFQNIVLKLPLFQGKQVNNGIRKATMPQRLLGRKNVSPALRKTRMSALVRKIRRMEKQDNVKTELQKELEKAPSRKTRLSAKPHLQSATADLDGLARKWWWLKRVLLKAPLNTLASTVRNNQGIRGNLEADPKPQKSSALSSKPSKAMRQGIRIWKLYNLSVVHKQPCKSVNSERAPSVKGEGETEKDENVPKALRGRQGSLNSSANGTNTWKVQSRFKRLFGHSTTMGKGLPISLASMKTKLMVIQRTQGFGNRVFLSVAEYAQISDGCSSCRKQNSTESRDNIQVLSRNESQEAKTSISNFIQEKLKFLFKVTSKDREHRGKFWSVYVRMPLEVHERKAKTFQRKIDRLVNPRASNRKSEVGLGAPELEDEGKTPQWLWLEEGRGRNSWNKAQAPSTGLLHSQLYAFIIRPQFNNSVMLQKKLTAFTEIFMAELPRKSQPGIAKLTGVLTALRAIISPKASSFPLESQQASSIRNLGKMRRLILNLWKTKHIFPTVLPGDVKLRNKKPVEPNDHDVSGSIQYQKLVHDNKSLSSDFLYFPGFAPSSELSKRQKRDAPQDTEMIQVRLDYLNHLSSLLAFGVGVIAVALIVLSTVVGILLYKRRELFQVSKVSVIGRKPQQKSCTAMDSDTHGFSLSRCFHSRGFQQVSRDKELELQGALQKRKRSKLGLVMTSINSDVSDTSFSVESMNLNQRSSLSSVSLGSFSSQSLEASPDWFSDEGGSLCSSSMKGGLVDRVQVYLDTMDAAENFQEFQCNVTVSEDQNYLGLEKTNQHQKMQMPKSVSSPLNASTSIPCSPQSKANASETSSDTLHPPESRDDSSTAFTGIPCPPQHGSNASKAASDISFQSQSGITSMDIAISECK